MDSRSRCRSSCHHKNESQPDTTCAFYIGTAYIIADTEVADMAFGGVVNRPVSNCREQMLTIIDMVYIDGILSF